MSRTRRLTFWLLALTLLLAQTVGQMHRTLHGPVLLARAAQAAGAASIDGTVSRDTDGFGHLSDTDCRLYDQLLHADLLHGSAAVPLAMVAPVAVLKAPVVAVVVAWRLRYEARGPPTPR